MVKQTRQQRTNRFLMYAGGGFVLIVLAAFFFSTVLAWLRFVSDEPLSSGSSAAYPLMQATFGLAISAVASTVALLLALRSVQSAEKERTIALLEVYQPEVSALVDEVNGLQDRLRDTISVFCQLARSGAHLAQSRLYQEYRQTGKIAAALEEILAHRLRAAKQEYIADVNAVGELDTWTDRDFPDWVHEQSEANYYFDSLHRSYLTAVLDGKTTPLTDSVDEKGQGGRGRENSEAPFFDLPTAIQAFQRDCLTAEHAFSELCEAITSPRSGLLHRVLTRRFDTLLTEGFATLADHLAQPLPTHLRADGASDPPNLREEGYFALAALPQLFGRHLPLAFLRSRDLTMAAYPTDQIPIVTLRTRVRILENVGEEGERVDSSARGYPLRGPKTPEQLGILLGRYLPCVTHNGISLPFDYLLEVDALSHPHSYDEQLCLNPEDVEDLQEWHASKGHKALTEDELANFLAQANDHHDEDPTAFSEAHADELRNPKPYSDAFFKLVDHYPEPLYSPAFSPVFVWIVPLFLRLIAPTGVLRELSDAMADLDLDGDLLKRHLRLQMLRLYSYEAFGDTSCPMEPVPDRASVWRDEC